MTSIKENEKGIHTSSEGLISKIGVSTSDHIVFGAYMRKLSLPYTIKDKEITIDAIPIHKLANVNPGEQYIIDSLFLLSIYTYWNMGLTIKSITNMTSNVYVSYLPNGGGLHANIKLYYLPLYTSRYSPNATDTLMAFIEKTFEEYTILHKTFPQHTFEELIRCLCSMKGLNILVYRTSMCPRVFKETESQKTAMLSTPCNLIVLATIFNICAEDRYASLSPCIEFILGSRALSGNSDTNYIESLSLERFIIPSVDEATIYINLLLFYNTKIDNEINQRSFAKLLSYGT